MARTDFPALHPAGWTDPADGRFNGTYPLNVETHARGQVNALLPGITSQTQHARSYALHTMVAAEAARRGLVAVEALTLLRRCEVVMSAISTVHASPHPGMAGAHGVNKIGPSLDTHGEVDVDALSQTGAYAKGQRGFWGAYLGPERVLGLVTETAKTGIELIDGLDPGPYVAGLGDLAEMARESTLSREVLAQRQDLCLCAGAGAADGEALAARLFPAKPLSTGAVRRQQTIAMLCRLVELRGGPVRDVVDDLTPMLLFDADVLADPVLSGLAVSDAWRGVVLRNESVRAWRDLWAWMVNEVFGLMSVRGLGERVAESLPQVSVAEFAAGLPEHTAGGVPGGVMLAAERDPGLADLDPVQQHFAVLFLGAARVGMLAERVGRYFESEVDDNDELTPSWLRAQIDVWADRPLRDFAVWLSEVLVARVQRRSLVNARIQNGMYQVSARVYVRDGYIFRDSLEFGGGVGLRWRNAVGVLAGVGFFEWQDPAANADGSGATAGGSDAPAAGWVVTERARGLL